MFCHAGALCVVVHSSFTEAASERWWSSPRKPQMRWSGIRGVAFCSAGHSVMRVRVAVTTRSHRGQFWCEFCILKLNRPRQCKRTQPWRVCSHSTCKWRGRTTSVVHPWVCCCIRGFSHGLVAAWRSVRKSPKPFSNPDSACCSEKHARFPDTEGSADSGLVSSNKNPACAAGKTLKDKLHLSKPWEKPRQRRPRDPRSGGWWRSQEEPRKRQRSRKPRTSPRRGLIGPIASENAEVEAIKKTKKGTQLLNHTGNASTRVAAWWKSGAPPMQSIVLAGLFRKP